MTGNASYEGDTLIQEGILEVYKNLQSPVHILSRGRLHLFPETVIHPKSTVTAVKTKELSKISEKVPLFMEITSEQKIQS
ncbi:hypothetical protein HMPREF9466_02276 [Fusobacterium necrophorum subsp. funduliforme 1_1_36S]|nr:hypothetical protein HMPREF9466_02276 [Fusobacterium necrophorum subsp. funduliforme 1_1_36S]